MISAPTSCKGLLICIFVILNGAGYLQAKEPNKYAFVIQEKKFTCADLPDHFANVETALDFIRNCRFEFEEAFEALAVRGIRNVSYHSCDKESGYLVLVTHDRTFIHKEVPIKIWEAFKYAESIETYYRLNIKFTYIPI
ncbi:MAG: KTSC domain-containing protein [Cyclobacteriaceae bacterium]|nr:KTSC domain-containing protein [Cyclobacteriaceae bacterium]